MPKNPKLIDLTGIKIGRWTILHQAGNTKNGATLWLCKCDCGSTKVVLGDSLRKNKSHSCGCLSKIITSRTFTKHGEKNSKLYAVWQSMRQRCDNPKNAGYKNYGGRGISVCQSWQDFIVFRNWAIKSGYSGKLTIERKDNNGNYEPDNCTWADKTTQSRNRRFVKKAPNGKPWSIVAIENGILNSAYRTRILNGWDYETASSWPMFKRRDGLQNKRDQSGRFVKNKARFYP